MTVYSGTGDQVCNFGQAWIRQTKGRWAGKPLIHEPWQRSSLNEMFLVYEDGSWVYREGLLGIARKNGKSTIGSELCLWALMATQEHSPEVYCLAASKDQAGIVFGQAKAMVEKSPKLKDWLIPRRNYIECPHNDGIFRVLSSDAPLQHGLNPYFVIVDELWAHKDPELYYAMTTGDIARENSLVLAITTAGFDRESICYKLYQRGRKLQEQGGIDACRRASFYFQWFEAGDRAAPDDVEGWMRANPSSWVTEQVLRRKYESLPEPVFRRLHMNQWTETEATWLKAWMWDQCEGKPIFDPDTPTWASVDVGITRDSAAITWGQWHDDKLHIGHEIMLPDEQGTDFGVADVRGRYAQRLATFHKPREANYDPWQFRESAEILAEAGFPMNEFPQSPARMGPASETIWELIKDGRVVHDGDLRLKQQVLSGVAVPTDRGGWRISKRKSRDRIDGLISLAMTADRAVTMRNAGPKLPPPGDIRIQQL